MQLKNGSIGQPPKRNLREQLVEQLGTDIVRGRLQPGDTLPHEDELLSRYDVSRTVLREALNVLSGKGLLDARPRRGTIVRPRTDWSQLDPSILAWRNGAPAIDRAALDRLIELRHMIEPPAAALAAIRGTRDDHADIRDAYEAMVAAETNVPAFVDADVAFHTACLRAARNDFLLPVAHAIRTCMTASMRITDSDTEINRTVVQPRHRAICIAILARDAPSARAAMIAHLEDAERQQAKMAPLPPV